MNTCNFSIGERRLKGVLDHMRCCAIFCEAVAGIPISYGLFGIGEIVFACIALFDQHSIELAHCLERFRLIPAVDIVILFILIDIYSFFNDIDQLTCKAVAQHLIHNIGIGYNTHSGKCLMDSLKDLQQLIYSLDLICLIAESLENIVTNGKELCGTCRRFAAKGNIVDLTVDRSTVKALCFAHRKILRAVFGDHIHRDLCAQASLCEVCESRCIVERDFLTADQHGLQDVLARPRQKLNGQIKI